jgi:hypothetical protein
MSSRPSTGIAEPAAARLRLRFGGILHRVTISRHGWVRSRPFAQQPSRESLPDPVHHERDSSGSAARPTTQTTRNPVMNAKRIGQLLALIVNATIVACAGNASRSGGRHPPCNPRASTRSHGSCGSMSMSNGPCPPKEKSSDTNQRWRLSRDAPPESGESGSDGNAKSKSRNKKPSEPSSYMGGSCGGMH